VIANLRTALPGRVVVDGSVGELCTYRVGGRARAIVDVDAVADLEVLQNIVPPEMPFLVIGAGSNLLVSDQGFPGIVLRLTDAFASVEYGERGPRGMSVVVGGAAMLPRVARQLTRAGLTGFEWAVGVPGSIGGAIRMNAGGHGSDMAASVTRASVFNMRTGGPVEWSSDELGFGYRRSRLGPDDLVLWVELSLDERDGGRGEDELAEIVRWRRAHQPGGQNAGSVFTNPPGRSAGQLIDRCGLKGFRIGTAQVSDRHANFIQADPGGSAEDILAVVDEVRRRVFERFGVQLQTENRLIGFADGDDRGAT
jgi:UDP-N-acetylmuramate dehydrogenase